MSELNDNHPDPNRRFVPEHGIIENSPLNPHHTSSQHPAPKPPKRHTGRNILIAVGAVVAVVVGAAALAPSQPAKAPTAVTSQAGTPVAKPSAAKPSTQPSPRVTHKPAPPMTTKPVEPAMTASQEQAVGTAEDYLRGQSFSRSGLIEQLGFEGFSAKDAKYGVDHAEEEVDGHLQKVNWSAQAIGVAKNYLTTQHFSRAGLIEQLEYEGFTHAQAVYGVTKAGL